MAKRRLSAEVASKLPPPADAEQVTTKTTGDVVEARSTSSTIRTISDLIAHCEFSMDEFVIVESQATKWEVATSDGEGGADVTELFRVFVKLKPKPLPSERDAVSAMILSASKKLRQRPLLKRLKPQRTGLWQVLIVADTHFGKLAVRQQDYDLPSSQRIVSDAAMELLDIGDSMRVERRSIVFLGDLFHVDTMKGTTSSLSTNLDSCASLPMLMEAGTDCLLSIIDRSGSTVPTTVYAVHGNHDEVLTHSFRRIASERYRGSKRVTVVSDHSGRQYQSWGGTLLGFAHGNRAFKKLPSLMAVESAQLWSTSSYREYHTGHLHHTAAHHARPSETLDGVIVRIAPALCPADQWHHSMGFGVGTRQAMESFIYRSGSGLSAIHIATPTART